MKARKVDSLDFTFVVTVIFDRKKKNTMTIMISNDLEEIPFSVPMDAKDNVEDYLNGLVSTMHETIRDSCRECDDQAGHMTPVEIVRKYPT